MTEYWIYMKMDANIKNWYTKRYLDIIIVELPVLRKYYIFLNLKLTEDVCIVYIHSKTSPLHEYLK